MRTSLICQWTWSRTPPSHTASGSLRLQPASQPLPAAASTCSRLKCCCCCVSSSAGASATQRRYAVNTNTTVSSVAANRKPRKGWTASVISSLFYLVLPSRISLNSAAGAGALRVSVEKKLLGVSDVLRAQC